MSISSTLYCTYLLPCFSRTISPTISSTVKFKCGFLGCLKVYVSGMMYEKPLFCCIPVFAGKCLISSALAYLTTSMIFRMAYVDCQFLTELLDAFFLLILRVISMFVPRKSLCTNKMPPFYLRSKSYACRMISLLTL